MSADLIVAERNLLVAVLAAGSASRFGGGKLDADCAGKAVGQWVLDTVTEAGLAPGVLVVGPVAPAFAIAASGWTLLPNPSPENGMGSSLALAAAMARQQGFDLLVLLADMPLIEAHYLKKLGELSGLVATGYPAARPGVPARFPWAMLDSVGELSGQRGAGKLLSQAQDIAILEPPAGSLHDIDSAQDLATAARILAARRGM